MKGNRITLFLVFIFIMSASIWCIRPSNFRKSYNEANELMYDEKELKAKPYLKAHLNNGDVIIFQSAWVFDSVALEFCGKAKHFDYNRTLIDFKQLCVPTSDIALLETNKPMGQYETERIGALVGNFVGNLAVTFYCLVNPKACFGSCPTFYRDPNLKLHYADAEGFSSAILPSLEYEDIDDIGTVNASSADFRLTMKNEAFETHYIKNISLLYIPLDENQKVIQTVDNQFYISTQTIPLLQAKAQSGTVTDVLSKNDADEYFALADKNNLLTKEEVILEFKTEKELEQVGLSLGFRQSLMSTFLFYHLIAQLGNEASDYAFRFNKNKQLQKLAKLDLGKIEVLLWNEQKQRWDAQGGFEETGPIAINKQTLLLSNQNEKTKNWKIKLKMTQGCWRVDFAELNVLNNQTEPEEIKPKKLLVNNSENITKLNQLNDENAYLIHFPGNQADLHFELPNKNGHLFLKSKGYYTEWLREEWMKEKNIPLAKTLIFNPKKYYKIMAPEFKKYETELEELFWNSRVETTVLR